MAGGGGKEEGYVKRLLRAHSEEGEDRDGRLEEERRTMPSKEDSWVLRKKASFESMWGGGGSQSLSLCLPKQDYYVSKPAKEEKQASGVFQVEEKVNEVENPVKTVIKEEEAAATVRAVAKEIEIGEIFGGADETSEACDLFGEEEVEEEDENKDTGLQEDGATGSQSDSEEKGCDGLNEEAAAEEEVPTPAGEEAVTLVREKVGSGGGCIQGGGSVPEGGAVDTVTREEAIR